VGLASYEGSGPLLRASRGTWPHTGHKGAAEDERSQGSSQGHDHSTERALNTERVLGPSACYELYGKAKESKRGQGASARSWRNVANARVAQGKT